MTRFPSVNCERIIHTFQIHVCATDFHHLGIFHFRYWLHDGCLGSNNDEGGSEV